jgi:hypothetical protein
MPTTRRVLRLVAVVSAIAALGACSTESLTAPGGAPTRAPVASQAPQAPGALARPETGPNAPQNSPTVADTSRGRPGRGIIIAW